MVKICSATYTNNEYTDIFNSYPFKLDHFQKHTIEAIEKNVHVLNTAHTGSGKTLGAEHIIQKCCPTGKKVIYTSPIKSLSNQKFYEFSKKFPELSFGIGIHKGQVLAGVMGNYELSKFGVVGDPINVAARVEALTREHNTDILITDEIMAELDGRFVLKKMPPVMVKGKSEPIVTYMVDGLLKK